MRYKNGISSDVEWTKFCVNRTAEEVAEHFNVAITTVRSRACALGIKLKKKERYLGITEYARSHTIRECADKYNVQIGTMTTYMRNNKISHKRELTSKDIERRAIKRTGEAQDMIITLCDFYTYASIARVFGYSTERVRQLYNSSLLERKVKE